MAIEQKTHSALTTHSVPFTLNGATSYQVDLVGTIADGSDAVELQMFQNGAFVQLDPPIRYTKLDVGGAKNTGLIPANATLRWTVPGFKNSVTTKITSSHG
ncbi:MAG TPA: hypothetical protein VJ255_17340 [Candidatus Acidoferrum sp.]|jgi:hypothetical protein|nr:hypothetical protein [Candidatus Acidoferrum sp.]